MSGLHTVTNDQGDRLTYYDNGGRPDPLTERLNEVFAQRAYADKYPKGEESRVQQQPASEHPRAQEEVA